jgi:hypothetical protein
VYPGFVALTKHPISVWFGMKVVFYQFLFHFIVKSLIKDRTSYVWDSLSNCNVLVCRFTVIGIREIIFDGKDKNLARGVL